MEIKQKNENFAKNTKFLIQIYKNFRFFRKISFQSVSRKEANFLGNRNCENFVV